MTQTLSGQVDVGWTAAPIAVDALQDGKIRIVARGSDVPAFAGQTVRFVVVNANAFASRPDVFRRYMQAYRETLDWMYADADALKAYAKWAGISNPSHGARAMNSFRRRTRYRTRFGASTKSWRMR